MYQMSWCPDCNYNYNCFRGSRNVNMKLSSARGTEFFVWRASSLIDVLPYVLSFRPSPVRRHEPVPELCPARMRLPGLQGLGLTPALDANSAGVMNPRDA